MPPSSGPLAFASQKARLAEWVHGVGLLLDPMERPKERRNVSADANEVPMRALFHPRMDWTIHSGDHASPLLGLLRSARRAG